MKYIFAFGFVLLSSAVIGAQVRPAPALGGNYASGAITRPLGGVASPSFQGTRKAGARRSVGGYGYSGPVYYVPNYFDTYSDYSQVAQAPVPDGGYSGQQPAPPVIINQYFTTRSDDKGYTAGSLAPPEDPASLSPGAMPGDPIGTPQNYYLIAYKDHTIVTAMAYWLEDKTLHYVTTQNTHNQASLDLIDLGQTTRLNADRAVPFSIPGK